MHAIVTHWVWLAISSAWVGLIGFITSVYASRLLGEHLSYKEGSEDRPQSAPASEIQIATYPPHEKLGPLVSLMFCAICLHITRSTGIIGSSGIMKDVLSEVLVTRSQPLDGISCSSCL